MTGSMVQRINHTIEDYQERLREMPYLPQTSLRRDSLGYCGYANKRSLTFLFSDHAFGLHFLKDVGLFRSKVQCNPCGRYMTWHADPTPLDRFRWRCRRGAGTRCYGCRSIEHGSWFQGSHLTIKEVLYLTYDILRREPAKQIQREHHCSDQT